MKITKTQLKRLIKEELKQLQEDEAAKLPRFSLAEIEYLKESGAPLPPHTLEEAGPVATAAATAATSIATEKLSSAAGREQVADLLVAIPEYIKAATCVKMGKMGKIGKLGAWICKKSTTATWAAFYMAASLLRVMDDKTAQSVAGAVTGKTAPAVAGGDKTAPAVAGGMQQGQP